MSADEPAILDRVREKYPLLRGVERLLHRRTHGLIGNSRAVFDQLATEVLDLRKLALIHNGIDMPPPTTAAEPSNVCANCLISRTTRW